MFSPFSKKLLSNICTYRFLYINQVKRVLNYPTNFGRMAFNYPVARRDDVKEDYHGVEVKDPYRWLEDPDSEETNKFIELQNAITQPYLDGYAFKEEIHKTVTKLWNYPKYSLPSKEGNKYYQYRNTGLQNQSVIYSLDTLESDAKVFLDPNLLSKDGTIALGQAKFSKDGKVFAYGLSESGSDWLEIKFRNVETGEDYPETLKRVRYSPMAWMHDNVGFIYGAYLDQKGKADGSETDSNENQKLYYHRLGTDQTEDIVIVAFPEQPQLRFGASVSHCGKYFILTASKGCKNNLLYFASLEGEVTGLLKLKPVVTTLESDYEYVTNTGSNFIIHTNNEAPNYRLISINFESPESKNWTTLIPPHKTDVLDWAKAINKNKLVLCYLRDVKHILSLHRLNDGEKIKDFDVDIGSITGMTGKWDQSEMFFGFVSFLTPHVIYKVDFEENTVKQTVFYETKVGNIDKTKYTTKQEFYTSKDGTQVPMFIVHKKDFVVDGSRPCMLYGYGGFNIKVTPSFSISRLVFANHFDGCFAVANIRGGGEYGDTWHNGGRFANKQNCFDDFHYAAKYLISNKYTNSDKITIMGGSNGGLLVAACINQEPQLYSAAICQVGLTDMLRFHKFTIGYAWKSDYGSSETESGFEYLYKYSPLHNIKPPADNIQYPSTLLLTADHDDRVVPLHSLKFIAELQRTVGSLPHQKNPLMVRVETKAGHGAGKPTSKLIEEITDILCFIAKSSNLDFHE